MIILPQVLLVDQVISLKMAVASHTVVTIISHFWLYHQPHISYIEGDARCFRCFITHTELVYTMFVVVAAPFAQGPRRPAGSAYEAGEAELRGADAVVVAERAALLAQDHRAQVAHARLLRAHAAAPRHAHIRVLIRGRSTGRSRSHVWSPLN